MKKYILLARALSRMHPRMVLFMVRRIGRNWLAENFPNAYKKRILRIEKTLPVLGLEMGICDPIRNMSEFYNQEYKESVGDASEGRITILGKTVDFGNCELIDWNIRLPEEGDHQLWNNKLGHMGFVCSMMLYQEHDYQEEIKRIILSAMKRTDMGAPGAFHSFWFPYAASHRILSLGSAYLVARSAGRIHPDVADVVERFLRLNVAFLLDNIEHELCNNHVERNLTALTLYFMHCSRVPDKIRVKLERELKYILQKTHLADGTQIERSPMYQGLSVAALDVLKEAEFLSEELREALRRSYRAARRAFSVLCHPDGDIALFNDAWHGEVPRVNKHCPLEVREVLPYGGYARLSSGDDVCLLDAGPLGPSWNPGHGHSDFLSIELSIGGRRLVVDPGTSHYSSGVGRDRERSAGAHNGPIWKGYEPVEYYGCFKVGRMAEARLLDLKECGPNVIAGVFLDRPGSTGRAIRYFPNQGFLVVDVWLGVGDAEVSWLIPGDWSLVACKQGKISACRSDSSEKYSIEFLGAELGVEITSSHHSRRYGQLLAAHSIRTSPLELKNHDKCLVSWFGYSSASVDISLYGEVLLGQLKTAIS